MRFDWLTLGLQTTNILVLLWLLRRFLFRPVADIVAARKDAAQKMLSYAAFAKEQARSEAELAARHENELSADRAQLLAKARVAAEAERARFLDQAKTEAVQLRDAARVSLERDRVEMRHDLQADAQQLAMAIALRLLDRVPPQALTAALLQSLDSWLGTRAPNEVQALAERGEAIEVVTSAPLDPESQTACARMLTRHFGPTPKFVFQTDPALIAGVELRSSHARLRNNWRADLDRIAQELSRDEERLALA